MSSVSSGAFEGGIGHRGEVAENLVHVQQRAQARGAGLRAHPADHLQQQQRHEEHALSVPEMRYRENRYPRLTLSVVKHSLQVDRLPLGPGLHRRCGEEVVELHGQLVAVLCGEEGLHVEHPNAHEGRRLDFLDELGDIQSAALLPRRLQDRRKQDVLPALQRIGIEAQQIEQAGGCCANPLSEHIGVFEDRPGRRVKGSQDGNRNPGVAAGGVDNELRRIPKPPYARPVLPPLGQPVAPQDGLLFRVLGGAQPLLAGIVFINPGQKVLRFQFREGEQEIGQIPFRIDYDGGDGIYGRLLEQADAQAGLAAAGHADTDRMRQQVLRVIQKEGPRRRGLGLTTQVEYAESFKLLHSACMVPQPTGPVQADSSICLRSCCRMRANSTKMRGLKPRPCADC